MTTSHPEPHGAFYYCEKKKAQKSDRNSIRLQFVKTNSMPNSVESLEYIKSTTQVAPDLLKALAILSDIMVRRFAVDQEDLKPYWKSEKRPRFSR